MEVNAKCEEDRLEFTQKMSITNIFKHPRFVEEYQKVNPAKWITVPIEEMSIIYRIINEGLSKDVHYPSGLIFEEKQMTKIYSGIMGLVVGDALGVPVEFKTHKKNRSAHSGYSVKMCGSVNSGKGVYVIEL